MGSSECVWMSLSIRLRGQPGATRVETHLRPAPNGHAGSWANPRRGVREGLLHARGGDPSQEYTASAACSAHHDQLQSRGAGHGEERQGT